MTQTVKKIYESITSEIGKKGTLGVLVYFLLISAAELLAYKGNTFFSVLSSRVWLVTGLLCIVVFACDCVMKLIRDIKEKNYFMIAGISVLIIFFGYYIGNVGYSDINADAAQQLAAGLSSFESKDWNYTGVAFLGYANRQYVLGALPALLFGRSIWSLHMGFAFPFLIGVIALFNEMRAWTKQDGVSEKVALIPMYALIGFPFIAEYYMNFEQAITPVALTMLGIALFMKLYRSPNVVAAVCLSWVGCLYCDSYTPILASLGLLLCMLALTALELCMKNGPDILQKRESSAYHKILLMGGLVANIGAFFIATLIPERSDRITTVREDVSVKELALESWSEFFFDKNAVFLGVFSGIVLLYIFFSFTGRLKFHDFTISVWVFGVVLFANYLVGYTSYEKAWILQRNMIVIPVLITGIYLAILRFMKKKELQCTTSIITVTMLFFLLLGCYNFSREHQSFNYFRYVQPVKYMIAYTEDSLEEYGLDETDEFNLVLVTDNLLQSNIYDYAKFFYPNAVAISVGSGQFAEGIDWSLPTFIFSEYYDDMQIFGGEAEERTFENKRYNTSTTWYRNVWMN